MRLSDIAAKLKGHDGEFDATRERISALEDEMKKLIVQWDQFLEKARLAPIIEPSDLPNLGPCPKIVEEYEYHTDPRKAKTDA